MDGRLFEQLLHRKVNNSYRVLDRSSWRLERLRGKSFAVQVTNLYLLRFVCVTEADMHA